MITQETDHERDIADYIKRVQLGAERARYLAEMSDIYSLSEQQDRRLTSVESDRIEELIAEVDRVNGLNPRICCEQEIFAVERYLRDCREMEQRGFCFDKKLALFAIEFFGLMKITQGEHAGEPFNLYPWQKFIVWNLFGWKWVATQARRYQQALIQIARGNGKTPFGAGLLFLAGGFMPDCPARGDNYVTATKRDQANIAYNDIDAILKACPDLAELCVVMTNQITVKHNGCTFQAVSSDGKTADGWRILTLLKDEFHAWDNTRKINEFNDKLETALGKFASSLSIVITTAGDEGSTKWIAYDKLARMVLDPESSVELDSMFVAIFELDENDDIFEFENYHKSNPMLEYGIVQEKFIRDFIAVAKIDPEKKRKLTRFHANRRVASSAKPFNSTIWVHGAREAPDTRLFVPCGGIDLGVTDDLASLAAAWKLPGEDVSDPNGESKHRFRWVIEVDVWVPTGGKRDLNKEPWASWIRDGWLRVTQSEWTDFNAIFDRVKERRELHGWHTIAYDKWNGRQIGIDIANEGIEVFPFEQSPKKYNEPCNEFEQAVFEKRLFHGGNPLLEWCAMNYVTVSNNDGHKRPDKQTSEEKIDPVVASIMAVSEAMFADPIQVSKYETEDVAVWGVTKDGDLDLLESELDDYLF